MLAVAAWRTRQGGGVKALFVLATSPRACFTGLAPSSALRTATPILATLQELHHAFVTNDNSRGAAAWAVATEYTVRHLPNGDVFSPILATLQELQHAFVTNDNSRGAAMTSPRDRQGGL